MSSKSWPTLSSVWVLILVPLLYVCVALVDRLKALLNEPDDLRRCVISTSETKQNLLEYTNSFDKNLKVYK